MIHASILINYIADVLVSYLCSIDNAFQSILRNEKFCKPQNHDWYRARFYMQSATIMVGYLKEYTEIYSEVKNNKFLNELVDFIKECFYSMPELDEIMIGRVEKLHELIFKYNLHDHVIDKNELKKYL